MAMTAKRAKTLPDAITERHEWTSSADGVWFPTARALVALPMSRFGLTAGRLCVFSAEGTALNQPTWSDGSETNVAQTWGPVR
jgi:hypothetical protein